MNGVDEIPVWMALLTSVLLVAGAAITLIGSLGLVRLPTFYHRAHEPTLGTTLGTALVAAASMVYVSALHSRPALHGLLVIAFVLVTTPVGLMILVRAAVLRDRPDRFEQAPEQDRR
jgi:multicomponent K+:H+ antiporter subunit G